ncbi:MAG: NAD-dependent epimerase/dehydratase family protein [Candidatus Altiarchaeales archaeon]|nr:NAD-dependent epimerase/dehydratase family protein [Candidatus Altiarchaeales archaeon]MBD3416618.1 NAD-dependent epimerase/dehydratase family protein [Candidatus Altiarchaeales archaeon]
MSKVLVTGGAGFIGSNTVDLLLEEGYDVAVVDDLSTGKRENLNPAVHFHKADVSSSKLDQVFKEEKPDFVVHLAAQINVRESFKDPIYDAGINIMGTVNLLESCRKNGVERIVYASSGGAVYGEPEQNPVGEGHPIAPLCPYGVSKYAGEKYVELYAENYGLDYNILRYGNVYGPRQDPLGEAGVIAIFAGLLHEGRPPVIFGDGGQTRDFCYVADIAGANLAGLRESGKSGVYNIGSGVETSVNDITAELIDAMGVDVEPEHSDTVPGEVRHIYLDVSLADGELGWKPVTGLRDGLSKTVEWVRNG